MRRASLQTCLWIVWLAVGESVAQDFPQKAQSGDAPAAVATNPLEEVVREALAERKLDEQLLKALSRPYQSTFVETPLADVVAHIRDSHEIRVRIDHEALNAAGIRTNSPITLTTRKHQPLGHVLNRIAASVPLAWTFDRGSIVLTSGDREKNLLETRVYRVGKLLRLAAAREAALEKRSSDVTSPQSAAGRFGFIAPFNHLLVDLVTQAVGGPWEESEGEGGTVVLLGDQLVVRQTFRVHQQVARLLEVVEQALAPELASRSPMRVATEAELTERSRLQRKLHEMEELHFVQTPLTHAVASLADQLDEEFYIDQSTLNEAGISDDIDISLPNGRYAIETALRRILSPNKLTFVIDNGAIRITMAAAAQTVLHTFVYDVGDLLRPSDDGESLKQTLMNAVGGDWRERDPLGGTGGTLTDFAGGLFVIRQTDAVHAEIARLLGDLRQARTEPAKEPAIEKLDAMTTRFYRAKSKDEAETLARLITTFVAPATWDSVRGRGRLRTAEDRLIIQQTKAVHAELDQFLREYREAKSLGQIAPMTETKP